MERLNSKRKGSESRADNEAKTREPEKYDILRGTSGSHYVVVNPEIDEEKGIQVEALEDHTLPKEGLYLSNYKKVEDGSNTLARLKDKVKKIRKRREQAEK